MPPVRLTLLLTTARIAGGLLTRAAWQALAAADCVCVAAGDRQVEPLQAAEMPVQQVSPGTLADLAAAGLQAAEDAGRVVIVLTGDQIDGDRLLDALVALDPSVEVDVLTGSHDLPGARVHDLICVMDRLRSPGGCPWDAEQTHASLVPYLVEEAHEAADALHADDRDHIVEELGDVLLQVVFHARLGQEHDLSPFGLDDIADGIVAKLVRRHPHVFGDVVADSPATVAVNWQAIKAEERAAAAGADEAVAPGPLDRIPTSLPPLTRAAAAVSHLDAAGRSATVDAVAQDATAGGRLFSLVAELVRSGVDPDAALRDVVRALA